MEHISTLLPKILRKRGIKEEADASLVTYVAEQWLKAQGNSPDARVTKLCAGTLFIEVASSVAAQELHAKSEELLAALRERFPDLPQTTVRIVRGRIDPSSSTL